MANAKVKRRLKPNAKRFFRFTTKLTVFIIAAIIIFQYVFGFFYMRGNYMFPNVKDGDLLMTFKFDTVVKNDLVVYTQDNTKRVGRVIAMEGDTVAFSDNGELLVNGNVANEEIFYATTEVSSSDIKYPYTVPEGEVFILNDYRSLDAEDSRTFKSVKNENVQGKVFFQLRRRGF